MIARALVNKPRILLFDEATSALDQRTQGTVNKAIDALQASRIVIAHRLNTVKAADRIYVLEKGKVIQEGTSQELDSQPAPHTVREAYVARSQNHRLPLNGEK